MYPGVIKTRPARTSGYFSQELSTRLNDPYQRETLQRILRDANVIANLDRTEAILISGDAYAHALGRANGMARNIAIELECLLGQK